VTSLGVRWRWALDAAWSAQLVALDGVPGDPNRPASNKIRFDSGDGALLAGEIGRQGERLRKVAVGAWRYTARFDDLDTGARSRGNQGVYALVDAQLFTERDDSAQGLSGFVRAGTANTRINRFANFIGAGVVYTGAFPQRPEDRLGLAVASAANGRPYRLAGERDGITTSRRETAIELTYRLAVTSWLTVQGDLQHIIDPDTNPLLADATAIGLRFEFTTTKQL
jgi:porin